jgi:CPA2 family monovalent cation:H+ antiporter-2
LDRATAIHRARHLERQTFSCYCKPVIHSYPIIPTLAAATHSYPLITTMAAAFTAAWVMGIITQKLRLSPIVGYLLAGVAIGPFTPGFVGDPTLAPQLAEIGVILLMFGVGLHFHLKDLLAVRTVAVPGAVGQSLVATILGVLVAVAFGLPFKLGLVLGMATAVASTVVLIRGLSDNKMLDTPHGHVAVGWLIVEDIFTVVLLVLIPAMGAAAGSAGAATTAAAAGSAGTSLWLTLLIALLKLAAMVAILLVGGAKVVPWVMVHVARLRSRELFTLTILVMAIATAAGSAYLFGASMALGAFLAGMVVGQSPVSQQAGADALPLRDAFGVLFFASVGMLFDPMFVVREPLFVLATLGIVMIGKPLAALAIVAIMGYPLRTGLTVAMGLAQIGEFSFILSDVARQNGLMNESGHNVIVACAILSISVNPFLFRLIGPAERAIQRSPRLSRLLNRRTRQRETRMNAQAEQLIEKSAEPLAVIVGYGPVGKSVDQILRNDGMRTVVVDLNMDTIQELTNAGRAAIFGDAFNIEVMHAALGPATHVIITLPHSANRDPLIAAAKLINPAVKVFVRARYLRERGELEQVGADAVCFEEVEAAVALAKLVLSDRNKEPDAINREVIRIRQQLQSESSALAG